MTNKEISSTTTAAKSEKNSETTLDTQEVLKETSSSKGALPSINFDVPEENTPQRMQLTKEEFVKGINSLLEFTEQAKRTVQDIISVLPSKETINNFVSNLAAIVDPIINSLKEFELYVEQLKPFIEKELKKEQQKHTEIKDITVDDIATISIFNLLNVDETELEQLKKEFANNQDPVINNIDLLLDIVRRAKEAFEVDKEKSLLPQISPKKITELQYPLDKVNSYLWGLMINETVALKAESDKDSKKGKQANIYVLLDFDELDGVKISRQLTSYDKRVFIAVANLKAQGHDTITAEQIYKAMGNPKRPNADTIKKILQSVECISRGRVTIDNSLYLQPKFAAAMQTGK